VTVHQRAALARPCYLAGETIHPRFSWMVRPGPVSLVLTVNAGYE